MSSDRQEKIFICRMTNDGKNLQLWIGWRKKLEADVFAMYLSIHISFSCFDDKYEKCSVGARVGMCV